MPNFVEKLTLQNTMRQLIVICAGFAGAAAALADGTQWQSVDEIRAAAEIHVRDLTGAAGNHTTVRASSLDPRHRLPRCDRDLNTFMRRGSTIGSRTVVGVECRGARPWKVYIPVDVVVMAKVVTARSTLSRGHLLTADDLVIAERDVSRMSAGYVSSPEALVGQRVKTQIIAGRVISPAMLEVDSIVARHQSVTLIANTNGITVSMTGKALADGALGQRIRVENSNSGRVIEGVVRSAEHVEILLPGSEIISTAKPKVSATSADTRGSDYDR